MTTIYSICYLIIGLISLIFFSVMAFWHSEGKLHGAIFILTGAISLIVGLYMYWLMRAIAWPLGLSLTIVFCGYWLVCWGYAYRLLKGGRDEAPSTERE